MTGDFIMPYSECSDCICYCANWDDEVEDMMDEQAPGEECSNGGNCSDPDPCPCFEREMTKEEIAEAKENWNVIQSRVNCGPYKMEI